MPVTIKKITIWRAEVENKPGMLAQTLGPLAAAGAGLQVVMGYRMPGEAARAAIEVCPVGTKKLQAAAQGAGLAASGIPALLIEGDDRPGLGHVMAQAVAEAGINLGFFVAQVIGKKYSAVIGLETAEDVKKVAAIIKKISAPKKTKKRR